jgi:hypothetical protein
LKKKIKDLKTSIQSAEEEIERIKKKIKLTNIKDLEVIIGYYLIIRLDNPSSI